MYPSRILLFYWIASKILGPIDICRNFFEVDTGIHGAILSIPEVLTPKSQSVNNHPEWKSEGFHENLLKTITFLDIYMLHSSEAYSKYCRGSMGLPIQSFAFRVAIDLDTCTLHASVYLLLAELNHRFNLDFSQWKRKAYQVWSQLPCYSSILNLQKSSWLLAVAHQVYPRSSWMCLLLQPMMQAWNFYP